MSKEDKDMGVVYVLTNPMMPGIIKIGMTTHSNVNAWIKELYSTVVHSQSHIHKSRDGSNLQNISNKTNDNSKKLLL